MSPLFESSDTPRLFAIPPGSDFAGALAAGLRARLSDAAPQAVASVSLTFNSARAARAFRAAMLEGADAGACWLPKLSLIGALGADPHAAPPAISPVRRLLRLTRLVESLLRARPELGPLAGAPRMAASLAALLDEFGREGVDLARLRDAAPDDHAAHWGLSLTFLEIIAESWPALLAEEGLSDPAARRRAEIAALAARWSAAPPRAPVLLAGTTGSVAATSALMRLIAGLPQGAVILPGFDPLHAAESWDRVAPGHPYAAIKALLDELALAPEAVPLWSGDGAAPRRALLAEALRPAPATDHWLSARPALASAAPAAVEGLALVEAPSPRREAEAIALAMRAEIEAGRRAELVTPDRALARRVTAELRRWGIIADDSAGRPLAQTPPVTFLRLIARLGFEDYDPVTLLALLKHPLAARGAARGTHLRETRNFELSVLRRRDPPGGLAACAAHPKTPEALAPVFAALTELRAAARPAPFADLAIAHRVCAEALAGAALWEEAAGEAARAAFDAMQAGADVYGDCAPGGYAPLLAACMTGEALEPAPRADARAAILGGLEARASRADLTILGGLVEGVWPPAPAPDPWLNRAMRAELGLPSPERRTGLAAHDFLNAACAPRAILTRSLRAEGKPTDASRLLRRLTTLLEGAAPEALAQMRTRGRVWLDWAEALCPAPTEADPAPRPRPAPPASARPRRLSVTDVETLIRDPYAVYARRILHLRALDPLAAEAGAAERGEALHAMMERYAALAMEGAAPEAAFDAACAAMLDARAPSQRLARLWRARALRLRATFLDEERERLAAGRPAALEREGRRLMADPPLELTARADRIDLREDGRLGLYDYKGGPPSPKQVAVFAKQLPLEAAIARAGGFDGLAAAEAAELAFISLKDGATHALEEPETLAAEAWEGLARLIAAYDRPGARWLARARPERIRFASDYDHLARLGEWRDGEG